MSNMVVRTNVMSINSHRNLGLVGNKQTRASQRLSSGFRINSAADDAAGLAISEKMRAQIRGLDMASRNGQDGISLIQTAEGAMSIVNDMVIRIRELVVQASNDTNAHDPNNRSQSDRIHIQREINALLNEIDDITLRTEFNTLRLLDGSLAPSGEVIIPDTANIEAALEAAGIDVNNATRAIIAGLVDYFDIGEDIAIADLVPEQWELFAELYAGSEPTPILVTDMVNGLAPPTLLGSDPTEIAANLATLVEWLNDGANLEADLDAAALDRLVAAAITHQAPGVLYGVAVEASAFAAAEVRAWVVENAVALHSLFEAAGTGAGASGATIEAFLAANLRPDLTINHAAITALATAIFDRWDSGGAGIERTVGRLALLAADDFDPLFAPAVLPVAPGSLHGITAGGVPLDVGRLLMWINANYQALFDAFDSYEHEFGATENASARYNLIAVIRGAGDLSALTVEEAGVIADVLGAIWDYAAPETAPNTNTVFQTANLETGENVGRFTQYFDEGITAVPAGALHGYIYAHGAFNQTALRNWVSTYAVALHDAAVNSVFEVISFVNTHLSAANPHFGLDQEQVTAIGNAIYTQWNAATSSPRTANNLTASQYLPDDFGAALFDPGRAAVAAGELHGVINAGTGELEEFRDWFNANREELADLIYEGGTGATEHGVLYGIFEGADPAEQVSTFVAWFNEHFGEEGINIIEGTTIPEAGDALWFHIGANTDQGVELTIQAVNVEKLSEAGNGIEPFRFSDLRNPPPYYENRGVVRARGADINQFIIAIDGALSHVTAQRAYLGATQNRLEFTVENLDIASENLNGANSRIRDADMAMEMMRLTQANILEQAAIAMLAQANQSPQSVLQLLR